MEKAEKQFGPEINTIQQVLPPPPPPPPHPNPHPPHDFLTTAPPPMAAAAAHCTLLATGNREYGRQPSLR